ncbi:MAG: NAD+ synthase [Candidatus Micrarchaeota archaeon]|nr:NAD+ synthase [Candidatus Micrarchaeota archaeon]
MDAKKTEAKIVSFIRGYFKKAGRKTAVVGVSGGLDSAAALALCVRALGSKNVIAALMNSSATPYADRSDAQTICKLLKVRHISFPIEPVLLAYGPLAKEKLARANLSARIRMAALYSVASKNNGLVVGTGDKSELLLGYFTKYGDGGADIFPIAGLYKTEVRALALHLGIPAKLANKPPSPALWARHTAEAELGFSYDEADEILKGIEKRMPQNALKKKFGKRTVSAVLKRIKENSHKSIPAPICKI